MRRFKHVSGNRYVSFKRDVHKSVRLDSRIFRYIMQTGGSGFADSLENLVIEHAGFTGRSSDLLN